MSFFIRSKKGKNIRSDRKRKLPGIIDSKNKKHSKKRKELPVDDDDEITSEDDEEQLDESRTNNTAYFDEDETETAQEKKLKLAKKYLEEIEKEERDRRENEDIDDDIILNRLKNDVLLESGKLRKYVADKISKSVKSDDIKILQCKQHRLPLTCIVISSDGAFLFSGSKDGTIVKWCLKTFKKLNHILRKSKDQSDDYFHSSPILALAISHEGIHLASCDTGNVIRIWSGESLKYLFSFSGHRNTVTGLAFDRFTQNLYSSSHDKTVRVWSVPDRAYIESLFGHQNNITSIDCLSKDKAISSGGTDNSVRIWKIQDESQLIFNGNHRNIDCVKRLNDRNFVSCGEDGNICLWSIMKKKPLYTVKCAHGVDEISREPNWISSIGTLSNTEIFASGSCDGLLKIWKCSEDFKMVNVLLEIPITGFINAISFSPDEKYIVLAVGKEHRLGRWKQVSGVKNCIEVIKLQIDSPN